MTLHHTQAAALLSCEAVYPVLKKSGMLKFPVRIVDVRETWGVIKCKITPQGGTGEVWVRLDSLTNLDPTEAHEKDHLPLVAKLHEIVSDDHILGGD